MNERRENLEDFFDEVINGGDCSASILDSILDCNQRYTGFDFYEEGGSKAIFKAQDQMTQRQVAFAKLKGSATKGQTENFLREARINALLQHPNIVPVKDWKSTNKAIFLETNANVLEDVTFVALILLLAKRPARFKHIWGMNLMFLFDVTHPSVANLD